MKLISLIRESPTMNEDEKNYWLTLIPHMKDDNKEKLEAILQKEKDIFVLIDSEFNS